MTVVPARRTGSTFTLGVSTPVLPTWTVMSSSFQTIPRKVLSSAGEVNAEILRLGESREELPFDMDGAVVKVNNLSDRVLVGSTAKCPRWAVAYKYPPAAVWHRSWGPAGAGSRRRRCGGWRRGPPRSPPAGG